MNPFDALLVPPALVKRALDDLHDIAQLARRAAGMEDELRARVAGLEQRLDTLIAELEPMHHLAAIRAGIDPLEKSMIAVRDSVDELEPMIEDLDKRIQLIEPRLAEMQQSVEPIGDLAERLPGGRRRRQS